MAGVNNYNFLFNSGNSNNNLAGLTNSLFGGTSSMLGDYAMIRSGTYKKLLTSYYRTQKANSEDGTDTSSKRYNRFDRTEKKVEQTEAQKKAAEMKNNFLTVKTEAGDLRSSAYALNSYTLYNEKTAEDGTRSYDRDAIKKAVKSYVSDYNNLITASSNVKSTGISSNVTGITKLTNDNQELLSSVGITVGKDNKLVLDEEKLGSADVNTLSKLFKGTGSYGSNVSTRATEIARQANSSAYNVTRASSSYSRGGSYSVMGNKNNTLNTFF